jgi:Tfp pilus assembly protein PilO
MIDLKDQSKNKKKSNSWKFFKMYIIPLVTLVVFFGIIIILMIPKVQKIFKDLNEISNTNQEIEEKDEHIASLIKLSSESLTTKNQLLKINEIAPEGTVEVVNFRDRITAIAQQNGLTVTLQQFSESGSDSGLVEKPAGDIVLQEVPTFFELNGTYSNIVNFLNGMDALEDFIVIKEMQLSRSSSFMDDWGLKLVLVKYQFNIADKMLLQELYKNISPTADIDTYVVEYLNKKV